MEELLNIEFTEDYKEQLLSIIKRSMMPGNTSISTAEASMLFHWKRHENDPAYSFVPEEYRGYK